MPEIVRSSYPYAGEYEDMQTAAEYYAQPSAPSLEEREARETETVTNIDLEKENQDHEVVTDYYSNT